MTFLSSVALRVVGVALSVASAAPAAGPIQFQTQIRPILEAHCLKCHGPDKRRGGLGLYDRETALLGGDSGERVIVPGDSGASALIRRVSSSDPEERMPAEGDPLTQAEIALLASWIDEGAVWDADDSATKLRHWSFIAPEKHAPPSVWRAGRVHNPIDAFILARLERDGLAPSPEADRYTLVRRAHIELIGIPPSPEKVAAFAADERPDAYERIVDELLASPNYGERQARGWLDAARYADTNGYEKDRPRSIWPYRDWVIDAFNRNMPFDEFVIEQLAGDLLPNATESQRIATGFHRNAMLNEEGGIDAAEDWFKRSVDRVNTTAAVFLGLTMGCAQCHSHKYDPITQREYYQFMAFFNDATEVTLPLADEKASAGRARIEQEAEGLEAWTLWLGRSNSEIHAECQDWIEETAEKASSWQIVRPDTLHSANGATLELLEDGSILATEDIPNDDTYEVEFETDGAPITAVRIEALPHESLPGGGPGRGVILAEGDFLLTEFKAEALSSGSKWVSVKIARATHDYAGEGRAADQALDGHADTGWSINGAIGREHAAVFEFAAPVSGKSSRLRLILEQDYIHQHTLGRFRISVTSDPGPVSALDVPAEIEAAFVVPEGSRSPEERAVIERHYYLRVAPKLGTWRDKIAKLRGSVPARESTLTMAARISPRETFIHHRGEFLSPTEKVEPGAPAMLPLMEADAPKDRLALARWLVDKRDPLLARVTMNRLWQQVFGRGLVATPEDFGMRSDPPTHPELLDWLAIAFMESDWNYKAMHRLMVTSSTFRQSSYVTEELLEHDPGNLLFARAPRPRVDAEVVRDSALAAAGLLNLAVGGPSVRPPQPSGVTALAYGSPDWPVSTGADRYRRGLYTYWKRTAPYPGAVLFDAPTGDETCLRRRQSNTPLQALALLNDQVFVEAARSMAWRVMTHDGRLGDRISHLFMLALNRPAALEEAQRVEEFYREMLARFEAGPRRAWEVSGPVGLFESERRAELAAWTMVCRSILNLDEMITRS
ncbi:MAG: PSD1 and planctomycete cytochrome C domain-containing protein [Candidatus Hydrogenedentota bacterium]